MQNYGHEHEPKWTLADHRDTMQSEVTFIIAGATMSLKRLLGLVLLASITTSPLSANKYPQITSFRQVDGLLKECGPKALVVFDVDETLLTSPENSFANFKISTLFKCKSLLKHCSLLCGGIEHFVSITFAGAQRIVFDEDIVSYIRDTLHSHEVPTIALTDISSGSYGVIPDMPLWRYEQLGRQQINFDPDKKFDTDFLFTNLPPRHHRHPRLYHGILCANGTAKGDVLGAFLDKYQKMLNTELVIFFDDEERHLDSVATACKQRGITFSGFQCVGAKEQYRQCSDEENSTYLSFILHHHRWPRPEELAAHHC